MVYNDVFNTKYYCHVSEITYKSTSNYFYSCEKMKPNDQNAAPGDPPMYQYGF